MTLRLSMMLVQITIQIFVYNFFLVQIWVKILVNHHPIQFTKKSAFAIWKIADQHKWHLDDNPVMSVQKVIQHAMEEKVALGCHESQLYPSGVKTTMKH